MNFTTTSATTKRRHLAIRGDQRMHDRFVDQIYLLLSSCASTSVHLLSSLLKPEGSKNGSARKKNGLFDELRHLSRKLCAALIVCQKKCQECESGGCDCDAGVDESSTRCDRLEKKCKEKGKDKAAPLVFSKFFTFKFSLLLHSPSLCSLPSPSFLCLLFISLGHASLSATCR